MDIRSFLLGVVLLGYSVVVMAGESLLLCGGPEVFEIALEQPQTKRWSWRATEREDVPEALRKAFATTDDCKPLDGGKRVLISSSSGGCALVERPSGKLLWWARVGNAHSIEMLPRDRIVVAGSIHPTGNKLAVYDVAAPNEIRWETELHSGHGVVWDAQRERLWALGFAELRCYALADWESAKPSLKLEATYPLPDEDGHDLQAVPESADLVLTTHLHVYFFDREKKTFRQHPVLGEREDVKCITTHPKSARTLFLQQEGKNWWSTRVHFLNPEGVVVLPGERLYKGRWLPE